MYTSVNVFYKNEYFHYTRYYVLLKTFLLHRPSINLCFSAPDSGICYKCGSLDHKSKECTSKGMFIVLSFKKNTHHRL